MIPLPELRFDWPDGAPGGEVMSREWLVTNGQGGYASGTLAGVNARRYHGLFVPTLPDRGRTVMLARLVETARVGGTTYRLDGEERADGTLVSDPVHLRAFRLEGLIPEWEYQLGPARLRKRLLLAYGENTLFVHWEHVSGPEIALRLRPFPVFRGHEHDFNPGYEEPLVVLHGQRMEMRAHKDAAPMHLRLYSDCAAPFVSLMEISAPQLHRIEKARGYRHVETQVSPGYFECTVGAGRPLSLGVTVHDRATLDRDPRVSFDLERERERRLLERAPERARTGVAARLVLAADQFIIDPMRQRDEAWARAVGEHARSIIAGYHWFTDWGRDTMISLEGLTLSTGRYREAAAILRTFRHHVRDGLLPNLFPEGESEGLYHTADATLWFFHAVDRYVEATGDEGLLRDFLPTFEGIVQKHLEGTRHNIRIDPADGLMTQGQEGYQLTWMDAKVDGWVVTPRRGKTVELNALWYNAMRLMAEWCERLGKDPAPYRAHAERASASFNARFWNPQTRCLFDLVDGEQGDDAAVRPNQVFAISLKYPVLAEEHWEAVLRRVERALVTPVGLRSLASDHPDYKATYDGDLRSRDAAYHQGTVWSWLLGHYVDAALRVHTEDPEHARRLLDGMEAHLRDAGVGQISEIFDATAPFRPRGCIAQAWGVAEALRVFLKTA